MHYGGVVQRVEQTPSLTDVARIFETVVCVDERSVRIAKDSQGQRPR